MKFYYNNQLMRTSKTHNYTHAVVKQLADGTFACMGCSATREGAEKLKAKELSYYSGCLSREIEALEHFKKGEREYWVKRSGRMYLRRFNKYDSVEMFELCINSNTKMVNEISSAWQIVELEAR